VPIDIVILFHPLPPETLVSVPIDIIIIIGWKRRWETRSEVETCYDRCAELQQWFRV
jgi:hypothetical protein